MATIIPNYNYANLPQISYFTNNQGNEDLRCQNYNYRLKNCGKKAAIYICSTPSCYASISLETETIDGNTKVKDPMIVNRLNMRHKTGCLPKDETFFEIKDFLKKVKEQIVSNPLLPIRQIYEKQRADVKQNSTTTFPDYEEVISQLKSSRAKNRVVAECAEKIKINQNQPTREPETTINQKNQPTRATCLADVVVHNTKTNSGDKFLIFDNIMIKIFYYYIMKIF